MEEENYCKSWNLGIAEEHKKITNIECSVAERFTAVFLSVLVQCWPLLWAYDRVC